MISLLWLLSLLFSAGLYKYVVFPTFISPLARIPAAHWSAHFSNIWILSVRYRRKENKDVHNAHLKFGPTIRLGPQEVSVGNLEGVKTIYMGGWEKHAWYSIFTNYRGIVNMFTMLDAQTHSRRRKQLSNVYSKSFLQGTPAIPAIAEEVIKRQFLGQLVLAASKNEPVQVLDLLNCLAMDVMSAYIFGLPSSTRFLRDSYKYRRFNHVYNERGRHSFIPQELPALLRIKKILGIPEYTKTEKEARREVDRFCLDLCNKSLERINNGVAGEHEAMVFKQLTAAWDKEFEALENKEDRESEREEIASEMLDHLLAGHETTAIALTYALYWLSLKQDVQKQLREEILSLRYPFHGAEASPIPSAKDVDSLPFLQAVLMETLRLNSPIPGAQPRISPAGAFLGKYGPLPIGTRVSAQAYSLHRNENAFPNPDTWDPNRWLRSRKRSNTFLDKDMSKWFWAFSSGGRMCIGSNFAMLESKMVLAAVFTNFETSIVDSSGIEQSDGYTVGPRGTFVLSLKSL